MADADSPSPLRTALGDSLPEMAFYAGWPEALPAVTVAQRVFST